MNEITELRYLILALQREGNRRYAALLRPLGLTPSQAETLTVLAERAPLTLSGLGELLVCESGTNPSRIVDRLVAGGLVRRDVDPGDRRQVRLTLTAAGRAAAGRVAEADAGLEETLAALAEPHQIAAAVGPLRGMAEQLPAGRALARRRSGPGA